MGVLAVKNEQQQELWRAIPEYEGYYEVSNMGRVRSLDRIDGNGKSFKGRVLAQTETVYGYYRVRLCKDGKPRSFMVHRLVAQAFKLISGDSHEVNHLDGDKKNCKADNLQWCNKSENLQHAYDTGLIQKKLSNKDVAFIRKYYKPRDKKYGATALAKRFGVSKQQIHNVLSGRSQPTFFKKKKKKKIS